MGPLLTLFSTPLADHPLTRPLKNYFLSSFRRLWNTVFSARGKGLHLTLRHARPATIRAPQKGPENWCHAKIVEKCRKIFWHFLTFFAPKILEKCRKYFWHFVTIFDLFWRGPFPPAPFAVRWHKDPKPWAPKLLKKKLENDPRNPDPELLEKNSKTQKKESSPFLPCSKRLQCFEALKGDFEDNWESPRKAGENGSGLLKCYKYLITRYFLWLTHRHLGAPHSWEPISPPCFR